MLTVKQVAAKLGVSAATVYGLCERKELAHVRVANSIRVSPNDLAAFLAGAAAAPSRRRLEQPSTETMPSGATTRSSEAPAAPGPVGTPTTPLDGSTR